MGLKDLILGGVGKIIEPVAGVFLKRQERKILKNSANAKIELAKQSGDQELKLTDAEWENASLKTQEDSWKDEYVTVIITLWIPILLVGCIYGAFTGDMSIVNGIKETLVIVKETGIDLGDLTKIVVFGAIGLKVWRGV